MTRNTDLGKKDAVGRATEVLVITKAHADLRGGHAKVGYPSRKSMAAAVVAAARPTSPEAIA